MNAPQEFTRIIGKRRYDVQTATLLADDVYWDGHNLERHGRNRFLYRTPNGAFFVVTLSQWQGEKDALEPIDLDTAIDLYEGPLSQHHVDYEAAFPDVQVEEA